MSTPRRRLVFNALANLPFFTPVRRAKILSWAGVTAGAGTVFDPGFRVSGPRTLSIGADCYFGFDSFIDCEGDVTIGDSSGLAQGARIISSGHELSPLPTGKIAGPLQPRRVTIGDQVWVGAGATILPGVSIANRCVIGAGAVVTRDTQPDGIYAGVPARRIGEVPAPASPIRPLTRVHDDARHADIAS